MADKIALRLEEDHRAAVALLLVSTEWNVLTVCHLPFIFKALANSNRSASPSVSRARKLSAGVLRLLTVLLEVHPLQRTRPFETIVREERGAAREVEQDGVGFWQKLSFFGLEHGDAPVRVDVFEERWRARLTPVYVVLDPFEWNTKLCQQ